MVLPTVSLAFYLTWKMRKSTEEVMHNLAVCCWILANSIWMISEFFYNDTTRPIALVFFVIGVGLMVYYYGFLLPFKRKSKDPQRFHLDENAD